MPQLIDHVLQNLNDAALRSLFTSTAMATDADVLCLTVEEQEDLIVGFPVFYRTYDKMVLVGHINKKKKVVLYRNYSKYLNQIVAKLIKEIKTIELVLQEGYYIISKEAKISRGCA